VSSALAIGRTDHQLVSICVVSLCDFAIFALFALKFLSHFLCLLLFTLSAHSRQLSPRWLSGTSDSPLG